MSGLTEGRTPGTRRKRLAGYIRAANEIRQTYQQNLTRSWNDGSDLNEDVSLPGSYPNSDLKETGAREELILFPSYSCWHQKRQPKSPSNVTPSLERHGQDAPNTNGFDNAEFWRQQWDDFEGNKAVVDVNVRGCLYSPHSGPLSRKQRLFIGLARQVTGLPAPPGEQRRQDVPDRGGNLTSSFIHDHAASFTNRQEQYQIEREADLLAQRGEREAAVADQGGYSEDPEPDTDDRRSQDPPVMHEPGSRSNRQRYHSQGTTDPIRGPRDGLLADRVKDKERLDPTNMAPKELTAANRLLISRIGPFLADPLVGSVISLFFYNNEVSCMKTVETDGYGHFAIHATLDFVPTNVRVLASESVSKTDDVKVWGMNGVSVISDIDDTVKHSAITSGAREIFRNVFIRNLEELEVEGVREWFTELAELGVEFHYVSNSPWQLFPVLSKFFSQGGLPLGSFHLKQYSGMLNGIFEPVAERKRNTLDKILKDFPQRRFLLVGDSGEADLEVYTDVAVANPRRILGVFIRDVTTSSWNRSLRAGRLPFHMDENISTNPENEARQASSRDNRSTNERTRRMAPERPPPLPARPEPLVAFEEEENLIDLDPIEVTTLKNSPTIFRSDTASILPHRPPKPRGLRGQPLPALYEGRSATTANFTQRQIVTSRPTKTPRKDVKQEPSEGSAEGCTTSSSLPPVDDTQPQQTVYTSASKKEELWWARWTSAKAILDKHGVVLESWNTGNDCRLSSISIVDKYTRSCS